MGRPREIQVTIARLAELAAVLREQGHSLVLCHGCFDVLTVGHVEHLEQAARMGTVLAVTVTPDRFVNKGLGRPILPEAVRARMLAALRCVDWVAINEHETAVAVIWAVQPSLYVKGRDSERNMTDGLQRERQAVEGCGGSLAFTDGEEFHSTDLMAQVMQRRAV